ncbi:MAG: NosD domain-containing protein, partial [Methanosarcina sp.]
MEELFINRVKLLLLAFLILTLSSGIGAAKTISVDDNGPADYATIQAAINNAASGDVVVVQPGTYTENVYINKTTLNDFTLMSASGNPADTIITASNTGANVITVDYRNKITIKGFTISGAGTDRAGVNLLGSRNCTVENNAFVNDALGVFLRTSVSNIVRNNTITRTSEIGIGRGINVEQSSYSTISGNSISNHRYGIYVTNSASCSISGNTVSDSTTHGMVVDRANNALVESNNVQSSRDFGIYLTQTNNNIVRNNVVSKSNNGINLVDSSGNTISNNAADYANHSIFLNGSHNNNLLSNTVSNSHFGIAMRYSNNNNITGNNALNNNIAAGDTGFYFTWTSNGNKISGNKANSNYNGFVVTNTAHNNVLENNEANLNANYGIYLESTNNNRVSGNSVSQNARGISLLGLTTRENTISGNIVNSNFGNGIHLENTSNNYIKDNSLDSNTGTGILLVYSNNSNVDNNTANNNNDKGIYVITSSRDKVSNNTALYNIKEGIMFSLADNNTVFRNIASNNYQGMSFNSSVDNDISGNTLEWNGLNGMFLCARSINNSVYNNNFYNVVNVNVKNARCIWNIAKTKGRNIMSGPYLGGNYWAKPDYTGHSQVTPDADGDYIADSAYVGENFVDNYPLIDAPDPIVPVADINTNVTGGYAPLSVQFTDLSQGATSRSWDFGYDKNSTSREQSPAYTYSTPGNYTVKLTASNENGTTTDTLAINVQKYVVLPVADFSANVTSGYAPLAVQFTDLSQNSIGRGWDFTNDWQGDSGEAAPVYVFTAPGT